MILLLILTRGIPSRVAAGIQLMLIRIYVLYQYCSEDISSSSDFMLALIDENRHFSLSFLNNGQCFQNRTGR